MINLYVVIDNYTPDAGSTIYGVFDSSKKANDQINILSSDDNEYGCNQNKDDTIEIDFHDVDKIINNEVFLIIDDYSPDAGSRLWGFFSTIEAANERLNQLESDDNEYGSNQNKDETIEIVSHKVR